LSRWRAGRRWRRQPAALLATWSGRLFRRS